MCVYSAHMTLIHPYFHQTDTMLKTPFTMYMHQPINFSH